jgi:hypothetical protein
MSVRFQFHFVNDDFVVEHCVINANFLVTFFHAFMPVSKLGCEMDNV